MAPLTAARAVAVDRATASLRGGDFLSLRETSPPAVLGLLDLADRLKADPSLCATALTGRSVAMIFEKPSLRTRVTFDVGVQQLGGHAVVVAPSAVGLGRRESIRDVARTLDRMVDAIVIRTFGHDVVQELADAAAVPVVNALTDFSHPCQALADYMTLRQVTGRLAGLTLAYVGDGNNVATSLAFGAAKLGVHLRIASPPGYDLPDEVLAWVHAQADRSRGRCLSMRDPRAAVEGADAVYTDAWTSMGQEREEEPRRRAFAAYRVDEALMAAAAPDAIFMHCLPAHRGDEVTNEVIDGPRSMVFEQAENRLHAQKAVMAALLGSAS